MKQKLFLLFIFFTGIATYAQNLTLNQLIDIQSKDLNNAKKVLTANGWEFLDYNKKNFEYTFAFHPDSSGNAENYFTYKDDPAYGIEVTVAAITKAVYNEYKKTLLANKFNLISSQPNGDNTERVYENSTHSIRTLSSYTSDISYFIVSKKG
ncbi:hypothetical protein [Flavobacterium pectinovorum]|uniref:hypothetical protein n=1 Tax=Flavobacterium pectinovorum TaxID=29533 RepID=UPI001FADAEC7|nr:hypothetical protein [Flavobacterium pectinovorum]MCI9844856.1 hypothetical protein [Flavobacterium pectinovorum]